MDNNDRTVLGTVVDAMQTMANTMRELDLRVTALRAILWTVADELPDRAALAKRLRGYARLQNELLLSSQLSDRDLQFLRVEVERFADQLHNLAQGKDEPVS